MTMSLTPLGVFIIVLIVAEYLVVAVIDALNVRAAAPALPPEFNGYYDAEKYAKSQRYLAENTQFSIFTDTIFTFLKVMFIMAGGFRFVDLYARHFEFGPVVTGLIFGGIVMGMYSLLQVPFSAYHTFAIEERFGFNRTTYATFIADLFKEWLIGGIIGGIIYAFMIWIFGAAGSHAWLYCWGAVSLFSLFISFVAPVVIMPLFNKFEPLAEGELKSALETYAAKLNFKMKGLFTMDGSKRSTKSNAFFTGFGRFRRIVLFDTLIARHTVDELVSVLAHEMGHYKKGHVLKAIGLFLISSGVMFFLLSFCVGSKMLSDAFLLREPSVYAGIFLFSFLFSPVSLLFGVLTNRISRKHEYEADTFAADTYGKPVALIEALKKLCVDNLSNLTPHPLKVALHYTHPPVLERIAALRGFEEKNAAH